MIIELEDFPEYKIYVFKKDPKINVNNLKEYFPDAEIAVIVKEKIIKGKLHIKYAAYNYLDTKNRFRKWIRDDNYRFLTFLLLTDQISEINRRLKEDGDEIIIILTKKEINLDKYIDIKIGEGNLDIITEIAFFRLNLEKNRS